MWTILLGAVESQEASTRKRWWFRKQQKGLKYSLDQTLLGRIRESIDRYQRQSISFFASTTIRRKLDELLRLFLVNNLHTLSERTDSQNSCLVHDFDASLLYLLGPCVFTIEMDIDCFVCFRHVVLLRDHFFSDKPLKTAVSKFMTLLQAFAPEIASHFEDEELSPNMWLLGITLS